MRRERKVRLDRALHDVAEHQSSRYYWAQQEDVTLNHPARLLIFGLGILLIVVAVGAPRGSLSLVELGAGAALICFALWLGPARKKGVALKDLPWIKATTKSNGSDSNSGA